MPDEGVLRLTSRPTQGDLLWIAAQFARGSTVSVAVGALIFGTASAALLLGDPVSLFFVVLGLAFVTGVAAIPFAWWSIRQRRDLHLAPAEITADTTGLTLHSALAESRHDWAVFRRARETSRAFLLDTGSGTALLIAKRDQNGELINAFRTMLAARGLLTFEGNRRGWIRWIATAAPVAGIGFVLMLVPLLIGDSRSNSTATIDLAATITGRTVSITGSTDLPDGTIVGIQVFHRDEWERELADGAQPSMDDWPWQTYEEILVRSGRIESIASVAGWPAGRGLVVAYFSVDGRQPAAVIDRFGRDGGGLRGRDVVDDPRNGRTLEITAPFEIGS